jgi:hypothetical protein
MIICSTWPGLLTAAPLFRSSQSSQSLVASRKKCLEVVSEVDPGLVPDSKTQVERVRVTYDDHQSIVIRPLPPRTSLSISDTLVSS